MYVTWLIDICDMTHMCMWHDSSVYVRSCAPAPDTIISVCVGIVLNVLRYMDIYVTWLIHVCDMTHICMWHDSSIYVTWLIHICEITHICMWHDSYMYVTWLIYVCDMTHRCLWGSLAPDTLHFICAGMVLDVSVCGIVLNENESCHTHEWEWVVSHAWMSHGTYRNAFLCATRTFIGKTIF